VSASHFLNFFETFFEFLIFLECLKLNFFLKKLGLKSNQFNKYEDQIEIHTVI